MSQVSNNNLSAEKWAIAAGVTTLALGALANKLLIHSRLTTWAVWNLTLSAVVGSATWAVKQPNPEKPIPSPLAAAPPPLEPKPKPIDPPPPPREPQPQPDHLPPHPALDAPETVHLGITAMNIPNRRVLGDADVTVRARTVDEIAEIKTCASPYIELICTQQIDSALVQLVLETHDKILIFAGAKSVSVSESLPFDRVFFPDATHVSINNVPQEALQSLARAMPNLEEIEGDVAGEALFSMLVEAPKLRACPAQAALSFAQADMRALTLKDIEEVGRLARFPNLEEITLDLDVEGITEVDLSGCSSQVISLVLAQLPNLEEVDLRGCAHVDPEQIIALRHLKTLHLDDNASVEPIQTDDPSLLAMLYCRPGCTHNLYEMFTAHPLYATPYQIAGVRAGLPAAQLFGPRDTTIDPVAVQQWLDSDQLNGDPITSVQRILLPLGVDQAPFQAKFPQATIEFVDHVVYFEDLSLPLTLKLLDLDREISLDRRVLAATGSKLLRDDLVGEWATEEVQMGLFSHDVIDIFKANPDGEHGRISELYRAQHPAGLADELVQTWADQFSHQTLESSQALVTLFELIAQPERLGAVEISRDLHVAAIAYDIEFVRQACQEWAMMQANPFQYASSLNDVKMMQALRQ